MSNIVVKIKMFGSFRKFGDVIDFSIPSGSNVALIKNTLQEKLDGEGLVMDSVLANSNKILRDSEVIDCDAELSILPPVCGG